MNTRALVLVVLALALVSQAGAQVSNGASVRRISLAEFKKLFDAGQVVTVDVRDAGSYANGHIPGAILMPLDAVRQQAPGLKAAKKPIVAYCA